jgi:hypothetical protein
MVRTKNITPSGRGDDEDPPRPFRQVKGKTVYLDQQGAKRRGVWIEPLVQRLQQQQQIRQSREVS